VAVACFGQDDGEGEPWLAVLRPRDDFEQFTYVVLRKDSARAHRSPRDVAR